MNRKRGLGKLNGKLNRRRIRRSVIERMIRIKLPFKTPTINHLYYHLPTGAKILTTAARKLRKDIEKIASNYTLMASRIVTGKR